MRSFEGYINYGVLAHEKQAVFSVGSPNCNAVCSDKIEITLPDGYSVSENEYGQILVGCAGWRTLPGIGYPVWDQGNPIFGLSKQEFVQKDKMPV